MIEDTENQEEQPLEATAEATPTGTEVLDGAEGDANKSSSVDNLNEETKSQVNLDEEVQFEVAGKSYTMKQAQIVEALEKANAIVEREKALAEREKSLNKDYTQKSQANAAFRKSIETTFGRYPEQDELKALGKIWNSYYKNPQAKQLIEQVLTGQFQAANGSGQNRDPYVASLEQQIADLKEQIGEVTTSLEERETNARNAEGMRVWSTWTKSKESQGIKITEEVDAKMAPFVSALRQAQPDWTPEQVLDEAYKHATIDQLKENAAKQTLVSADKAKKQGIIKVTPKGGVKTDGGRSYRDMLLEAA